MRKGENFSAGLNGLRFKSIFFTQDGRFLIIKQFEGILDIFELGKCFPVVPRIPFPRELHYVIFLLIKLFVRNFIHI